jgi:hypothetical protein
MKMTVGPLPPAVYWRRRAAVGAVLIAILLGFATCQAGGSTPKQTKSSASRSKTTVATASPTPGAATPSPSAKAALPRKAPADVDPAPQNAPAAVGNGSTAPDCADADLQVLASLDRGEVAYGSMPKLHLTVGNTGSAPCRRDVGANAQELRVMDGTRRLWSSDDCQPLRGSSVRTLQPGRKLVYTVTWSGKDSVPGCREARTRVSPGRYQLVARLDSLMSERISFRIS